MRLKKEQHFRESREMVSLHESKNEFVYTTMYMKSLQQSPKKKLARGIPPSACSGTTKLGRGEKKGRREEGGK